MLHLDVAVHVAALRAAEGAVRAREGLLPRVRAQVAPEVDRTPEEAAAVGARLAALSAAPVPQGLVRRAGGGRQPRQQVGQCVGRDPSLQERQGSLQYGLDASSPAGHCVNP